MSFIQRNQRVRPTMQNLSEAASIGHLDQPLPLMPFNDQQQFPVNDDKHMLDFYEHSLIKAFEQVEELKRIRRSCICSSSSSSSSSRLKSVSVRRSGNTFKKSSGSRSGNTFKKSSGSHGRRSRASSIQTGDLKESVTSGGLMLAVDKFLTAEFQKH